MFDEELRPNSTSNSVNCNISKLSLLYAVKQLIYYKNKIKLNMKKPIAQNLSNFIQIVC